MRNDVVRGKHRQVSARAVKALVGSRDIIGLTVFLSLLVMNYRHVSIFDVFDDVQSLQPDTTTPIEIIGAQQHATKRPKPMTVQSGSKKLRSTRVTEDAISPTKNSGFLVEDGDFIYKGDKTSFDSAPIVDEKHKLIFFSVPKVACTSFKFLFRRIMGAPDWDLQDDIHQRNLPHNPEHNNLKYLWDYDPETASKMMTDPEWTRAIFVREPKERFLSAFLDKAMSNYGSFATQHCCPDVVQCSKDNRKKLNFNGELVDFIRSCQEPSWNSRSNHEVPFWHEDIACCSILKKCNEKITNIPSFLETIRNCHDDHWAPQSNRLDEKYWKYINFVGRMETMSEDTEKLLRRVGAWEEYAKSGWGTYHNKSMIETNGGSQTHTTGSSSKLLEWFTPDLERMVEDFYSEDYKNPVLNFEKVNFTEEGEILKITDNIYTRLHWDLAPIVIQKYKLVFFTQPKVGATIWKQALRRMEGLDDWKELWGEKQLPHNPETNGLKYLYDFPIHEAEMMMTSPDWVRAIFVRNPKDRFLSAFTHMRRNWEEVDKRCCPNKPGCSSNVKDMRDFIELSKTCYSSHWEPYSVRLPGKWWKYINFVGKLENVEVDAEQLLRSIGAWELIGETGWGENGDEKIFAHDPQSFDSVHEALGLYSKEADEMLNEYYKIDYENKYLDFQSKKVHIMHL